MQGHTPQDRYDSTYATHGKSITGAEYMRKEFGPVPRRLYPVREELIEARDAVVIPRTHFGRPQKRLVPMRDPDLSGFSGAEIALLDEITGELEVLLPLIRGDDYTLALRAIETAGAIGPAAKAAIPAFWSASRGATTNCQRR